MAGAGIIHSPSGLSADLEMIAFVDRLLGYERGVPAVVLGVDTDDVEIAEPINTSIQATVNPHETLSVYVKRLESFIDLKFREAEDLCRYFSKTPRLIVRAVREESPLETIYGKGAIRLIETVNEVLGLKISRDLKGIVGLHPWLATEFSTVEDEDLIETFVPERISRQVASAWRNDNILDMAEVYNVIPELDSIKFVPTENGLDVATLNAVRNSFKLVFPHNESVEISVYVYLLTKMRQVLTTYGHILESELGSTDDLLAYTTVLTSLDENAYEISAHASAPGAL